MSRLSASEGVVRLPLRLNDLVRDIDREPRIPDLTLAERLGFRKPHNVRKLIDRNRDELALHGEIVERASNFLRDGEKAAGRGRPGVMYFLNEGQALVVCALSRTPIAARVRQDIIAVYMAHRRGEEFLPIETRERWALRDICELAHLHTLRRDDDRGFGRQQVLVVPVTSTILAVLAEFEPLEPAPRQPDGKPPIFAESDAVDFDDEDDSDAEPEETDQDAGEMPEAVNEDGGDIQDEPHDDGYGVHAVDAEDGDPREDTALERAGAGFIASRGDDAEDSYDAELVNEDGDDSDKEPSLGSVNPVPGIYGLVMRMPRGSVWLAPPGIDQTNWAQGSNDDREQDAGDDGEPEDGC